MKARHKEIYTSLAPVYDTLMADVDYESWGDFIDEIIQTHHHNPIDILELACGTGSLSISLAELECYNITGTDLSPDMIEIARDKASKFEVEAEFFPMNYLDISFENKFDCIFTVFDSVNYLREESELLTFLQRTHRSLRTGGLLIFDFSTPRNSMESVDYLNENEGDTGQFRFYRTSRYDAKQKIHYNEFEIEELDPKTGKVINTFFEQHKQRAYSLSEVLSIVEQSPYHLVAKYDGFDLIDATENSARVTMVLRCQTPQ